MDLTSVKSIKGLCANLGIKPSKKLGQNFLISKSIVEKIASSADIQPDDQVLEIGPGIGVLTNELVKKTDSLVLVEKDKRLIEWVGDQYKDVRLAQGDVLQKNIKDLGIFGDYKIVSNLPYNITSPVLWKFLHETKDKPQEMVVMVQREVAERIVAGPGKMSVLAVMCQFYADCEKFFDVPRSCFWPEPEVESAVVKLKIKNQKLKFNSDKLLIRLVKTGFSAKRKMLKNNLSDGLQISQEEVIKSLKKVGLDEKVRAQELSVEEWVGLYKELPRLR